MSEKPIDSVARNGMVLPIPIYACLGTSNFYELAARCLNMRESGMLREEIKQTLAREIQTIPQSFNDVWDMSYTLKNMQDIARQAESREAVRRFINWPNPAETT